MPRLLLNGAWFEAVQPDAIYESDFEALLMSQAAELYPDFHLVKFKYLVETEYGSGRPDLALIARDYTSWWIVEVELGSHDLRNHVERQVTIFSNGRYGPETADYIAERNSNLSATSLHDMMRGAPPRVLVVVNKSRRDWAQALTRWDALVAVVELFRDQTNKTILRVNGDHPRVQEEIVTTCRTDPRLRKSLVIDAPAALGVPNGERVELVFEGGITEWKRIDARGTTWLMPLKRSPLGKAKGHFQILRADDNRLILTPGKEPRRMRL
jgi:hypothetical protein